MLYRVTTPYIVNTAYINSNGHANSICHTEWKTGKIHQMHCPDTYDQWKNLKSQDLNQSSQATYQYANTGAQFTLLFSFHPYTILWLESVHDLSINLQYRSSLAHVRSYPNTVTIFLSRLNLAKSVNSAQTSMQSNPHIQAFQILANNWFTKCIKTCKSGIKTIKSFSDRWSRPLSSVVLSPLQP